MHGNGPGGPNQGMFTVTGTATFTASITIEKIKVAHLGVAAGPIPELVAAQLKLPKGTGLAVEMVEPDSPAAAAGLKRNDVLTKIDDQILVNTPQLQVLVRLHKAGDEVKLTFIREGQVQTATAKLAEREVPDMPPPPPMHGMTPIALPSLPPGPMPGAVCPMQGGCPNGGPGMKRFEIREGNEGSPCPEPKCEIIKPK
jgi:membrane-associated protease RseP (regulator of RpoE activity)